MTASAELDPVPLQYVEALGRSVSPAQDVQALLALVRSIFRFRPDVVHTHTAKAGALGRAAAVIFNLSRRPSRRCAIVHTFHGHVFTGYFGRLGSLTARLIERLLAMTADCIIVISERQRADIVERFRIAPSGKVVVIPLGLRLDALYALTPSSPSLRAELGIPADAVVFGFVGRFAAIKDVPLLVEAFLQAAARCPNAHLVLIGDGESRAEAEALARGSEARSRIHFLGWRLDLPAVYATIDVGVLMSRNEGTPVALIETMAAGKPVLATCVGGVPDVVDDGQNGVLIPSGDPAACAAAMGRLASEPGLRASLGACARERSRGFDHARLTSDIAKLYTALLSRRRR